MLGRIACAGLCAAFIGCYNAPKPDCGFVCSDQGECPEDYHCVAADDMRCHRNGTPDSLVCRDGDAPPPPPPPKMDAAPPGDAKPDAHPADAMPAPDAAVDAAVDASVDAN